MASHSPDVMTIERAQKSFNEAVSLTGYGKYNIFVLLATGGCLMCVIIETMNMSFIIPAAQCDLHLTLSEKGILVSISFLGVITTSHFWGFMADYRGRRNILILSLITSSILSIIGSVIPWAWLFILLRYINGAFIGGASSIIYAFAGEFHDDYYRPKVISWVSAFVALGQMYIPGMAWAILSQKWEFPVDAFGITFRPWRLLIIAYALPSLIVAAMMSILPESPKFLLAKGKHDHTIKILRKMFVINTGKNSIEYPVCTVFLDEFVTEQSTEKKTNFFKLIWKQSVLLFKKEFRLKTILICYLQFGVFLSASALALWFPQILNSLSKFAQTVGNANVTLCGSIMNEEVSQTKYSKFLLAYKGNFWRSYDSRIDDGEICDDSVDTSVFLVVLLIAVAIMITYIVIGIFINKLGKKSILVGGTILTAVSGLVAQYISGFETILILCGIYLLITSMVGVVNALAVDIYPTNIRAMAIAVSLMFGRLGAMVGSNIVGVIFYSYCSYIFIFFAINHLLLVVSTLILPLKKTKI